MDDVLDLTRVESGKVVLQREWVGIQDIVFEAMEAIRPLVDTKGLNLIASVSEDLPQVYCDRTRIRQVVLNLTSNAARFTESGSVTVEAYAQEGHVIVGVTDTGPGISPDDRAVIFEPFSQGAGDVWRDRGGSGLGLSISQQFVNLHNGHLWVESELGSGSSFRFKLPISPPTESVGRPGHQIREDWIWREAAFRTERAGTAEQAQRPVITLMDPGGELYHELARYQNQVEIVSLDSSELLTDRYETCPADLLICNAAACRDERDTDLSDTMVVQCSLSDPVTKARSLGATGYLTKPVSRDDLATVLANHGEPIKRVLIVDDDPDVCRLFRRMLELCDASLEVLTASDGNEGLAHVRTGGFDLVLLDIVMGDLSGWDWLSQVRADPAISDLPVCFVTAQDLVEGPPTSPYLTMRVPGGFSARKLLRCSLEVSRLLRIPDAQLDLVPARTPAEEQV